MVSITIEKLPSENILRIFEFLDVKTMLNASQVCKNWSDLIESSTKIMKKLKLCLNKRDLPEEVGRKYINVDIGVYYNFFKETFEKIADIDFDTSMTRNLRLTTVKKFDIPSMMKLLSQMPKLESFCLMLRICTNEFDESKIKHLTLPNLKVLNFFYDKENFILKFIKAEQLSELKLFELGNIYSNEKIIPNFLKGCSKLKKMSLFGAAFKEMADSQQEFDFKLEIFGIGMNLLWDVSDQTYLDKFLASQSSTLMCLCFHGAYGLTRKNIRSVFKLKILKKLVFENCFLEEDIKLHPILYLRSLTTLNELAIIDIQQPENFTKLILEKCRNLKKLKLQCLFEGALKHISVYCRSLVSLSVEEFSDSSDTDINLPQLKHLEVHSFSNKWLSLAVSCPSIVSLDVQYVSETQILEKEFDVVFQELKLSHLILKSKSSHCDIFVSNNYHVNDAKLKTLRLSFQSILDHVMFELTLDASQWSIEDRGFLKQQILNNYPEAEQNMFCTEECESPPKDIGFQHIVSRVPPFRCFKHYPNPERYMLLSDNDRRLPDCN